MIKQTEQCRIFELYKKISLGLADPHLLNSLRRLFTRRQTLRELLDWLHVRVKFNKGCAVRHSSPFQILEYGEGRCREFSVLFTAICLANGYRARLILDLSDHAWTEVWDENQKEWIHVDPSERRVDDPGMYEREWKKKLEEVYSFEAGNSEEVTGHYQIRHRRSPAESSIQRARRQKR